LKNTQQIIHFILNAHREPLEFELPRAGDEDGGSRRRWIDTSLDSPHDIVEWQSAPPFVHPKYSAAPVP
jgi:glycogen operon protein